MCFNSIPVWYLCKTCKEAFQTLDRFIDHKRSKHLVEIAKIKCIVFEDTLHFQNLNQSIPSSKLSRCKNQNQPITNRNTKKGSVSITSTSEPHLSFKEEIQSEPDEEYLPETETTLKTRSNNCTDDENETDTSCYDPADIEIKTEAEWVEYFDEEDVESYPFVNTDAAAFDFPAPIIPADLNVSQNPRQNVDLLSNVNTSVDADLNLNFIHRPKIQLVTYSNNNTRLGPALATVVPDETTGNLNRDRALDHAESLTSNLTHAQKTLLLAHNIDRPFACNICGAAFKAQPTLKNHLAVHTDLRPYKCTKSNCSATFKTTKGLGQHKRLSHAETKPFGCLYEGCAKMFKTKHYLSAHLGTHLNYEDTGTGTGQGAARRVYKCTVDNCNKICFRKEHLKFHMSLKHKINGDTQTVKM